jgi:hypothetical protein
MIAYLDLTKLNTFQAVSANATISGTISGINYLSGLPFRDQLLNTTVTLDSFISDIQTKVDNLRDGLELINPYVTATISGTTVQALTASGMQPIDPLVRAVIVVPDATGSGIYTAADFYRTSQNLVGALETHSGLITNLDAAFDVSGSDIELKKDLTGGSIQSFKGLIDHFTNHAFTTAVSTVVYIPLCGSNVEAAGEAYQHRLIAPWDGKITQIQI